MFDDKLLLMFSDLGWIFFILESYKKNLLFSFDLQKSFNRNRFILVIDRVDNLLTFHSFLLSTQQEPKFTWPLLALGVLAVGCGLFASR